jgi:hypothetical protein
VGEGRWLEKGIGGRIWCKYCVHMYVNIKIIPAETVPGIGRGDRGEWWRG